VRESTAGSFRNMRSLLSSRNWIRPHKSGAATTSISSQASMPISRCAFGAASRSIRLSRNRLKALRALFAVGSRRRAGTARPKPFSVSGFATSFARVVQPGPVWRTARRSQGDHRAPGARRDGARDHGHQRPPEPCSVTRVLLGSGSWPTCPTLRERINGRSGVVAIPTGLDRALFFNSLRRSGTAEPTMKSQGFPERVSHLLPPQSAFASLYDRRFILAELIHSPGYQSRRDRPKLQSDAAGEGKCVERSEGGPSQAAAPRCIGACPACQDNAATLICSLEQSRARKHTNSL
jgi:hypothetical protein